MRRQLLQQTVNPKLLDLRAMRRQLLLQVTAVKTLVLMKVQGIMRKTSINESRQQMNKLLTILYEKRIGHFFHDDFFQIHFEGVVNIIEQKMTY